MRLIKLLLASIAALGLSTGAVFAGGDSMTHESSQSSEQGVSELLSDAQPMTSPEEYSMESPEEYFAQGPEYEAYDPPVLGNELG